MATQHGDITDNKNESRVEMNKCMWFGVRVLKGCGQSWVLYEVKGSSSEFEFTIG